MSKTAIKSTKPVNLQASLSVEAAEGQQPRFDLVAYTGDVMTVGGWGATVLDLQGLQLKPQVPLLYDHSDTLDSILGQTESVTIDGTNLRATGLLMPSGKHTPEVVGLAKEGYRWQASVGVRVLQHEEVEPDATISVNGKTVIGPVTVIRKGSLDEISLVVLGADRSTSVNITAKNEGKMDTQEFRDWLSQMGFSFDDLTDSQRESLFKLFSPPADEKPEEGEETPPAAEAQSDEDKQKSPPAEAQSDEDTEPMNPPSQSRWSPAHAVQASRPIHNGLPVQGQPSFEKILEAGLRMGAGHRDLEKSYKPEVLEAAERYRRMTFKEMVSVCAQREGVGVPRVGASERDWVRAAFSTRSLPNVLKNTANKTMLDGYQMIEKSSLVVSRIMNANDFKEHTAVQLTGDYMAKKVGADGMLQFAKVTDQGYTYRIDTYGRLIGLTRQDIINDDMGAFTDLPRQIGRGAALALENAFWSMVESATGSFFKTANKNVLTGASSAFGISSVSAAVTLLRKQTDAEGQPIKLTPRFLAVPPDLEVDADNLYVSQNLVIAGATDAEKLQNNPHRNKYKPVMSEYLSGTGATSPWYLIADPNDIPAFMVSFLRGQQTPIIEEADPQPGYLGQLWQGYIDFGVALADHRAAVRAAGN